MKWALAFATARVLAEKIEFLEVPIIHHPPNRHSINLDRPHILSYKTVIYAL